MQKEFEPAKRAAADRWRCRPFHGLGRFLWFHPGACAPGLCCHLLRRFSPTKVWSLGQSSGPWHMLESLLLCACVFYSSQSRFV